MSVLPTNNFAKEQLRRFGALALEEQMDFICDINHGKAIVQLMRVRLSRLRDKAKRAGRTVKAFKMICLSVQEVETANGRFEKVTLIKTANSRTDLMNALDELDEIPGIIGGVKLNVRA